MALLSDGCKIYAVHPDEVAPSRRCLGFPYPTGSVSQVMHGAALVRAQSPFGFSPHRKKL